MKISSFILLIVLIASFSIKAQVGLRVPINLPTAKVMPKGVRNLTYKGVMVKADEKFNTHGDSRALADPLFTELTFDNLIDGQHDSEDRAKLQAKMIEIGANPSDIFGRTLGQVNVKAYSNVPIFAWGVTETFTAAIAIPVTRTSINVRSGVEQTNDELFEAFRSALGISQGALSEFDRKLGDPINAKLADYNYKPLVNQEATKLGDIILVAKKRMLENSRNRLALSAMLTLPTGEEADPNKVIDIAGGEGQTDIGAAVAYDYILTPEFEISTNFEYTVQLPDTDTKRVPFTIRSKITPDLDDNIDRDLGDFLHAQIALKYNRKGFGAVAGYSFQYREADTYEGSKYAAERYRWLGRETQQRMQAVQLSLGYDTLTLFKQKKFAAPLKASINHIRFVEGKNVLQSPIWTMDFSLFF